MTDDIDFGTHDFALWTACNSVDSEPESPADGTILAKRVSSGDCRLPLQKATVKRDKLQATIAR